jgi:pilus assembly protein CpaB
MRRVIAIIAAIALAAVGTFLIVQYVGSAEDRALEGEKLVEVYVVDRPIDEGTGAEDIAGLVRRENVPQKIAAEDAIGDLDDLEGTVAVVDLVPGEQLIAGRFLDREAYLESLGAPEIPVPDDKLAVTVSLDPDRAVGGQLTAGSSVAVIASFDPFDISANIVEPSELTDEEILEIITAITEEEEEGAEGRTQRLSTPNSTKIILHKILVTNVQLERLPQEVESEDGEPVRDVALAPTGNLLVTLALDPVEAQQVVFTAEFGYVWLAVEGDQVDETETRVETRGTVYEFEPE